MIFPLDPGDTLFFIDDHVVDSMKTVALPNGQTRRQFFFSSPNSPSLVNSYIEGIGGENGLLEPFHFLVVSGLTSKTEIICYTEQEEMLFGICESPSYVTVSHHDVNSLATQSIAIEMFPNPTDDRIRLRIAKPDQYRQFTILDKVGRRFKDGLIPPVEEFSIDVSDFPGGLYFLLVWEGEKVVQLFKLSIN